jgi:hypothetical protein
LTKVTAYYYGMPRIWSETIAAHRDAVRDAILDATAALVAEHTLTATMSQIAREAYRPGHALQVLPGHQESILAAGTERHIAATCTI